MFVWDDRRPRPGWEQMAIDRALLDLADREALHCLRLYRWDRDTVSFGANESAARHWDAGAFAEAGIPAVRRPTGGRAVWHDATDLTYALVAPVTGLPAARALYRSTHAALAAALDTLGTATALAPAPARSPDLGAGSCFEGAAGGEVLVAGRKTIGSAQLIHRNALLQHGEIARAMRHAALARFARQGGGVATGEMAGILPPADQVADTIAGAWRRDGADPAAAAQIAAWETAGASWHEHFRDPAWTWRR